MDPIDARLQRNVPPIRERHAKRRQSAGDFRKTVKQAETTTGEVVTERKTSEISLRWDMLGLDFRRVSTIEKRLAKAAQGEALRLQDSSVSAEQVEVASESIGEGRKAEDSANEARTRRAYLPSDVPRETLRYQA